MKKIIENIRLKLQEKAGVLGIVPRGVKGSGLTVSFKNKEKITKKNLEKLAGVISDALTASGVKEENIEELELKIVFLSPEDKRIRITLTLEGKDLKIEIEK
jgi:hypothetical protein